MAQLRKRRRELSICEQLENFPSKCKKIKCHEPLSLLDLSAQCVAANIPFQRVEENISRIPEPVQLRIGYWSFPRNEKEICMYSSLHASVCHSDLKKLPFQRGLWLLEKNAVKDVLQVGFHLSGKVIEEDSGSHCNQTEEYKVSINFDRCKITSVSCSCGSKDILWCSHVVALSIYRIRNPENVTLRVPISETLLQMNRDQLQKLVQYLITEHQAEVLPTAQRLADEILQSKSEINRLPGAPDPTAGASVDDDNCWHLDAEQVREQVRNYLSQGGYCSSGKQLLSMFAKVREMLRVKDKNGSRMLKLITEQFLEDPRLQLWKEQGTNMNDKCRQLWDQLGALWVCVVLNPDSNQDEKISWRKELEAWSELEVCPMENPDERRSQEGPSAEGHRGSGLRRTVFSRAIAACRLNWNDTKLERILRGTESQVNLTWTEDVPIAAARVDALRAHGYFEEALRLAVAVARGMKEEQLHKFHKVQSLLEKLSEDELEEQLYEEMDEDEYVEGWIGHPLEPIVLLYDTLTEESQIESDTNFDFDMDNSTNNTKVSTKLKDMHGYDHKPVKGSKDDSESYLTLALEVALLGLGQQRTMPVGFYAQDKSCRQEEHLIAQLNLLKFDDRLLTVLNEQLEILLGSGPFSGLGLGVHPTSIPMHTFARFLYGVLLPHDPKLAFRVGLRAMRFVLLDSAADIERGVNMRTRASRWFTLGHLESQQSELASHMLTSAKGQADQLKSVLLSAQRHIHSPSQLFRLAQDALKLANINAADAECDQDMLDVAMELGLQVLRMTLENGNWRRHEMVQWLVECAIEVGTSALSTIMKNWSTLFTPTEATTVVAATVMSPATSEKLHLTPREKDALLCCARALSLQCASRSPQLCALSALTICEKDAIAFEAAYRLVLEAAGNIRPTQLFAIARYMEHKGHDLRAFKLATLAMKHFTLAYNQDSHPSIGDIHWACTLAHSLGQDKLGQIIPLVIRSVHCPTVLSDLLYRCTFTPTTSCDRGFRCSKYLGCDKEPLRQLLEATIDAYVSTTHSRLNHISPKHYVDFIDFLMKAKESFQLAPEGEKRFAALVNNMKILYRGKKKLMQLVKERFG